MPSCLSIHKHNVSDFCIASRSVQPQKSQGLRFLWKQWKCLESPAVSTTQSSNSFIFSEKQPNSKQHYLRDFLDELQAYLVRLLKSYMLFSGLLQINPLSLQGFSMTQGKTQRFCQGSELPTCPWTCIKSMFVRTNKKHAWCMANLNDTESGCEGSWCGGLQDCKMQDCLKSCKSTRAVNGACFHCIARAGLWTAWQNVATNAQSLATSYTDLTVLQQRVALNRICSFCFHIILILPLRSGHVNGTCSLIFLLFVGLHCLPNAKKVLSDGSSGSDHIIHNQPWPREQPPTLMKAHYMHFDSSDRFLPWHSENLSHDFLLSSWAVPCSHWRKFPI